MLRKFWISLSNRHDVIYKYFLILVTVVLIVIGLPSKRNSISLTALENPGPTTTSWRHSIMPS
jgi:hypothetical protein